MLALPIASRDMRIVSITNIRQDATKLIDEAEHSHEPILVIRRSRPAAYVVAASDYEEMQRELRRLRHEMFWHDVETAEEEYRRGEAHAYENADELIAALDLKAPAPKSRSRRASRKHELVS